MRVSLREWIETGAFSRLEIGMLRETVEGIIGTPTNWFIDSPDNRNSSIWKYGDIELYFQNDALSMIFTDDFKIPCGNDQLELDAWIINGQLTVQEAEKQLQQAAISYRKEDFPYNENGVHLVTDSGVRLAFSGETARRSRLHALYQKA